MQSGGIAVRTLDRAETTAGTIPPIEVATLFALSLASISETRATTEVLSCVQLVDSLEELCSAPRALDFPPPIRTFAGMVEAGVVCNINDLKILNPVVASVSVPVMDVLGSRERASEMTLHDEAMLAHVDTVSGELYVAVKPDSPRDLAPLSRAASVTTEADVPSGDSARLDFKTASASLTDQSHRHSSPPRSSSTSASMTASGTTVKGF